MPESEDKSPTPFAKWSLYLEEVLRLGEIVAVVVLTCLVWITAVGTGIWVVFQPTVRLPLVLGNLTLNWKACLLLIIPMFYRTIQAILQRIKKWPGGMESQDPEEAKKERTPPQQQRTPPSPKRTVSAEEEG